MNFYNYEGTGAIRRLFNIAREDSLASWFMVTQTTVAAFVLLLTGFIEREKNISTAKFIGWLLLALFFFYLSADDGAKIHERLGTLFAQQQSSEDPSALFPSYRWQVAVLPFLALCGIMMLIFLWSEFTRWQSHLLLLIAPAVMAIAVGLDFFEGLEHDHPWNLHTWLSETLQQSPRTIRHFSKAVEELLEMIAISLLLMLFFQRLLDALAPQWTIFIKSDENASRAPGNLRGR